MSICHICISINFCQSLFTHQLSISQVQYSGGKKKSINLKTLKLLVWKKITFARGLFSFINFH